MSSKASIKMRVRVKADPGKAQEQMEAMFAPMLEPYTIRVDNEHAEFLEFGSTPARDSTPKYSGGEISPVERKFREWVTRAKGLPTGGVKPTKGDRIAKAVYKQAMEKGVPPYPFLRPALYEVMNQIANGDDLGMVEAMSVEPAVERIVERMIANITAHGMVHGDESLIDSIEYGPSSQFEELTDTATDIGPDLWARRDGGRPGAPPQGSRNRRL